METLSITSQAKRLANAAKSRFAWIWIMLLALMIVSPLFAPGSLSASSLSATLPYAAILILAAVGQSIVIAQRGIDLSVPGFMALGAVIFTKLPESQGISVWLAILVALLAGFVAGLLTGIFTVSVGIAAFVTTLAMNSILIGVVMYISNGFPATSTTAMSKFAVSKFMNISVLFLIAVVVTIIMQVLLTRTVLGRRFLAIGGNEPSVHLLGIHTKRYEIFSYAVASLLYTIAGILLAMYLRTPDLMLGNSYQLSSIVAVVLGGTLLTGGIMSFLATAVAAVFLTQLDQMVLSMGASTAVQMLVQAIVLTVAIVVRKIDFKQFFQGRKKK